MLPTLYVPRPADQMLAAVHAPPSMDTLGVPTIWVVASCPLNLIFTV